MSEDDTSIEKTASYWNSVDNMPSELVGVFPMGRCGIVEVFYRHFFEVRHVKQQVRFHKEMHVLELGCGTGRWALSLSPLVKSYVGVDFSRSSLATAERNVSRAGLDNVQFHCRSITTFTESRPLDVIFFSGVTQYLQDDEISAILDNLSPCMQDSTILIDRSTVNYKKRENFQQQDYFAIFRTPAEIQNLFASHAFQLRYSKRSYRFLRGRSILQARRYRKMIIRAVQLTRPVSYFALLFLSFIADVIHPIPFEGGDRSHDFFIFDRVQ